MHLRDLIASIHPFCLVLVVKTTQTFISITYTKITEIIQISILYNLCNRCIKVPGKKHSGGIINCCNFFWKKKNLILQKACKTFTAKNTKAKNKSNSRTKCPFYFSFYLQSPNLLTIRSLNSIFLTSITTEFLESPLNHFKYFFWISLTAPFHFKF